ncbi:MAG TPA: DUF3347 domain-containing protein [Mucilaginibacter sp.]|jgi:hypothetical protein|nr:DUF3347 domain-containing protein [Mucilaginibacter sp.]
MKTLKIAALMLALSFAVLMVNAQPANNIDKITNAYFGLKNALATGSGAAAENSAKSLLEALAAPEQLNADQQKIFNNYIEKLKFDTRHISEVSDIEHQREHFESLSKNLYEVLKGLKMNTSTVYMDYCPMKKAYWLSETQAIKNPYYSDKTMATCGKTATTLAAAK